MGDLCLRHFYVWGAMYVTETIGAETESQFEGENVSLIKAEPLEVGENSMMWQSFLLKTGLCFLSWGCYRSDYKTLIELSVWRKKALPFPSILCSSLSFHQCVHLPVFLSIQLSVWLSTHPPRQLVNFLSIDCVSHNVLGMGYGNELSRVSAPLECGPRGGR